MKYLMMIYQNPATWASMSTADQRGMMDEAESVINDLIKSGEWIGGEGLADISQTKVVRVRDGDQVTTDGPYLEAKEYLAGYCLVECESVERAVEIAGRWPDARLTGIEVRPLMDAAGLEM